MKLLNALFVTIFLVFLNGLTISLLWEWFIHPTFSLPILNFSQAVGLGLLISYSTFNTSSQNQETDTSEIVAIRIIITLITLLIGWVIK